MASPTLVLTPWYTPHQIIDWQEAICKVYCPDCVEKGGPCGKTTCSRDAEVLAEYEEVVSSPSLSMKIPSVIRLTSKAMKPVKKDVKYSWSNVLTRDNFTCQYCGNQFSVKRLNRDHVKPRVLGGQTGWDNIVTSCKTCNSKKGGRTPEQAGMKLLRRPARPASLPISVPFAPIREIPKDWEPYWKGVRLLDAG